LKRNQHPAFWAGVSVSGASAVARTGILPVHGALQSSSDQLKKASSRIKKNMKTRWFTKAAIVAGILCCASGLLYAQDNGDVAVTRNVWSGVYSIAQAKRGQDTYYQVCAQCHGRELEGDDSEGVTPLAGPHFMTNWDTHTAADLVKRIHAQPNDEPGDIDLPTQVDLFAFIMAFNQVPAGNEDLSMDRKTEAAIGITAQPPAGIAPNATP
jgi:hypothetical protein